MSLWRFGYGWSESEMRAYLAALESRSVNFTTPPEHMVASHGWTVDGADRRIGVEPPGPPLSDGLFSRAKQAIINYDFSDPRIVVGHFDPSGPLLGRDILLEIKVLGLRFLNGVRVHSIRDETDDQRTIFGFRYDTLEGHIEQGFEWFALSKSHETGTIRFRIEAHWRLGDFPNWWSRVGFLIVGARYREVWRRLAVKRLRALADAPAVKPVATSGHLAHRGDVTPQRTDTRPS